MRMRTIVLFGGFLLVASIASAQPTTSWTETNVTSTAQAAAFTYRLTVTPNGGTALAPIVLASVTCSGTAPSVACTAPLPAAGVAALITGAKSVLTAQDTTNGTSESAPSLPFTPAAAVPTGLKVGP